MTKVVAYLKNRKQLMSNSTGDINIYIYIDIYRITGLSLPTNIMNRHT